MKIWILTPCIYNAANDVQNILVIVNACLTILVYFSGERQEWTASSFCCIIFRILWGSPHVQVLPVTQSPKNNYVKLEYYSGLRRCHWTMVCRGFVIMSCQCFVSVAPEPFLPETWKLGNYNFLHLKQDVTVIRV